MTTTTPFHHYERAARRKAIADLVRAGATVFEAAVAHRVSAVTARNACYEWGVTPAKLPRRRVRLRTFLILARLLNTTDTYRKIGHDLRAHYQWVGEVAQQARDAGIRCRVDGGAT